jgi:hypothetical protein
MEIMKNNQVQILEVKTSINLIQTTMDSIVSRQDQTEEIILQMEDKMEEILHANNYKEKNTHESHIQELWNTVRRPNIRIHGVEEGAEIQTKGIGNLFNDIIAEIFPDLCNDVDTNM